MKTPEGVVKAAVIKVLKDAGAWHAVIHRLGYGVSGVPDILACLDGRFIAVEVKAPGKAPTRLQQVQLLGIQAAGGDALVIDDAAVLRDWVSARFPPRQ